MPSSPTLLILAGGMGSRYCGLKQIDGVGPNGEAILEYSIFDALREGFGKVVCVIRREIETEMRDFVETRLPKSVPIEFAYQELEDLPEGAVMPVTRTKPWGTGHAVLAARRSIETPFLTINADDFYGRESISVAFRFLAEPTHENDFAIIGYRLASTLSDHGSVSRAICRMDEDGWLQEIVERRRLAGKNERIISELDGNQNEVSGDTPVSMNMIALRPHIFSTLKSEFCRFLGNASNDTQVEFLLPDVLNRALANGDIRIRVLPTSANWFGITYPQDRTLAEDNLQQLVRLGEYPAPLWQAE